MTEEVPIVPRLNVDPASWILLVFDFSAYEIPSYDFETDVMLLRPPIDHVLGMDRNSPYWPPLVYFCILSRCLLLSGIDGYGSLRLLPIVQQMARQCMPFPLTLAETFT
ncbi:hypothetical protein JCGZ_25689 [Jatropha curcas]|uniref:Uncharacterized protein n=1 Tax=Jatropha curcas TaxID=180498 RepID=A0A067LQH2_JATCU|nr:hypothetical protein JCGZ_25689 [Jatropha curcas]